MKIGITERGDASIDYSWVGKLPDVDGAILITKNITDKFISTVMEVYANITKNIIVHCTCTGFGSTKMEPNVPPTERQLAQFKKLMDAGFPKEKCVLRIDPIIPYEKELDVAIGVIKTAEQLGILPGVRIRISLLDNYAHVNGRMSRLGLHELYDGRYQPSVVDTYYAIVKLKETGYTFECCAEPAMQILYPEIFVSQGCISSKEVELFGMSAVGLSLNPQKRAGCKCLSCKTELLSNNKHRCAHQCAYCYWWD